ncbi:TPA: LysR family transcriptional regulator [Candidatus Bathyarchaeota archaeon]|nr:LysR family transcriptional regulator [Candidatus Bathyarchaeota archaeon]
MGALYLRRWVSEFKVWLEKDGSRLLGGGGAAILEAIDRLGSISMAAKRLGMSYKYVWDYLVAIESSLGKPVVETYRGGKKGGGGARLTIAGRRILAEFRRVEGRLAGALEETAYRSVEDLGLSVRNRLKGRIEGLKVEGPLAEVKIRLKTPALVKAILTREAVEELKLKEGNEVEALVKATSVMVAKKGRK